MKLYSEIMAEAEIKADESLAKRRAAKNPFLSSSKALTLLQEAMALEDEAAALYDLARNYYMKAGRIG